MIPLGNSMTLDPAWQIRRSSESEMRKGQPRGSIKDAIFEIAHILSEFHEDGVEGNEIWIFNPLVGNGYKATVISNGGRLTKNAFMVFRKCYRTQVTGDGTLTFREMKWVWF